MKACMTAAKPKPRATAAVPAIISSCRTRMVETLDYCTSGCKSDTYLLVQHLLHQ